MNDLILSAAPHIKTARTTKKIMLDVLIALIPATAAGIVFFGWQALVLILLSLLFSFLTEFVYYIVQNAVWKNAKTTVLDFFKQFDFTSLVTGLLLALTLPARIEGWYLPILGSIFAVAVVKMLFGGTGKNIVNPALAGRIFLFISFTALMTSYPEANPAFGFLGDFAPNTGASPLNPVLAGNQSMALVDLFLGTGISGCIGETCKLALLVGGIYLVARGVIKWYLPLLYLVTEGLVACIFVGKMSVFLPSICSGGVMLGAIFMATDYTTTPKTKLGNIIYFVFLGVLTAVLRHAAQTEVTSFVILIGNFAVFLLDLLLPARPFGAPLFGARRPRRSAKKEEKQ